MIKIEEMSLQMKMSTMFQLLDNVYKLNPL